MTCLFGEGGFPLACELLNATRGSRTSLPLSRHIEFIGDTFASTTSDAIQTRLLPRVPGRFTADTGLGALGAPRRCAEVELNAVQWQRGQCLRLNESVEVRERVR